MYVPAFLEINQPFQVTFNDNNEKYASFPNSMVVIEQGAKAILFTEIISGDNNEILRDSKLYASVGETASLNYLEIQNLNQHSYHFSNSWVTLMKNANFYSSIANFGSLLTKTRFGCSLQGQGAKADLHGIYFGNNEQHFDMRTIQYHESRDTTSNVFYKGAVRDHAHSIYQGLIKVFPDAQKTDAYQSDKNLILNSNARADSIPSLEIEANDVRCTHGATTGKINEEEIFYLMTRGLSHSQARKMIVNGFFEDVIKYVPDQLQEKYRVIVDEKL